METARKPSANKLKSGKIEDWFLQTSFDINVAIQAFVRRFELQHMVTIRDYAVEKEAVLEGIYFLSGIIRLSFVFLKSNQLFRSSVILKVPQLGAYPNHGKYMLSYDKEKYVYETVFPLMYESWSHERVVPDFHGATASGILVLENLKESGYYQKPHGSLLDFSTCKIVLKSLAQFHALSIRYMEKVRSNIDSLTVVDKGNSDWPKKIYTAMVRKLRLYVLPSCSEFIRRHFDKYIENVSSIFELGQLPNLGGFNVILHGDLHYYNILFRNDDQQNTPTQCKFVDFQNSRRGSPVLDIMLFLVTSAKYEVVEKENQSLFKCYLDTLAATMKELEPTLTCPYGMNEFFHDFGKYKLHFLFPLISLVPFFWAGEGDLDAINSENEIDKVFRSEAYINFFKGWMKYLLPKS